MPWRAGLGSSDPAREWRWWLDDYPGTLLGDLCLCARSVPPIIPLALSPIYEQHRIDAATRLATGQTGEPRRFFTPRGTFFPGRWELMRFVFESRYGSGASTEIGKNRGVVSEKVIARYRWMLDEAFSNWPSGREAWVDISVPALVVAAQGVNRLKPVGEWYQEIRTKFRNEIERELLGSTLASKDSRVGRLSDEHQTEETLAEGDPSPAPTEIMAMADMRAEALISWAEYRADLERIFEHAGLTGPERDLVLAYASVQLLHRGSLDKLAADFGVSPATLRQRMRRLRLRLRAAASDLGVPMELGTSKYLSVSQTAVVRVG